MCVIKIKYDENNPFLCIVLVFFSFMFVYLICVQTCCLICHWFVFVLVPVEPTYSTHAHTSAHICAECIRSDFNRLANVNTMRNFKIAWFIKCMRNSNSKRLSSGYHNYYYSLPANTFANRVQISFFAILSQCH